MAEEHHGRRSQEALRRCLLEGRVIACEVVWAEVAGLFSSDARASDALTRLGIVFDALTQEAALAAGSSWRSYRRCSGTRGRVIADFLVGAHAASRAERLLTRDRGFYRDYFTGLRIVDPAPS